MRGHGDKSPRDCMGAPKSIVIAWGNLEGVIQMCFVNGVLIFYSESLHFGGKFVQNYFCLSEGILSIRQAAFRNNRNGMLK